MEKALQTFSPREVQARVRAGESPDVVAAEFGWPMDKVMRYAEPLLAERAFIAQQAQTVEIRRSGGGATLLESAYDAIGADPEAGTIAWDAYRREDGKWIVTAEYTDGDGTHQARWTYDHAGRNLHPLDDDARTLLGARPVAVPDPEIDIAEALDLVAEAPAEREPEPRPRLVAVPDAPEDESADADEPSEADAQETIAIAHPSLLDSPEATAPEPEPVPEPKPEPKAAARSSAKAPAAKKPRTRKGRASVPSWDEILFGATKQDE